MLPGNPPGTRDSYRAFDSDSARLLGWPTAPSWATAPAEKAESNQQTLQRYHGWSRSQAA